MQPNEPGKYSAREIVFGLGNTRMPSPIEIVEVVADVPNPRGHKLLVRTGLQRPRYRSLDCYEWLSVDGSLASGAPESRV
jgi:hypothetical protein